jgi:hypothetical protein
MESGMADFADPRDKETFARLQRTLKAHKDWGIGNKPEPSNTITGCYGVALVPPRTPAREVFYFRSKEAAEQAITNITNEQSPEG